MAWTNLPTNYTDATWSGNKKYNITDDSSGDGTKNITDVTSYTNRENSFFGAKDANKMNTALNYIMNALENGTDLYEDFQTYFTNQKAAFKTQADSVISATQSEADTKYAELTDYVDTLKSQATSAVNSLRSDSNTAYNGLVDYINQLESDGNSKMTSVETSFESTMTEYERLQKEAFDTWFTNIKNQLSDDVATSLQSRLTDIDDRLDRFANMIVQNDYYAPLAVSDGVVLTDGVGNIFVADWHMATTENVSDTALSIN